jgi:glucosyl-3-phosphoglycerate synthase
MSDFFQNGVIATHHILVSDQSDDIEKRILRYTKENPIALILPAAVMEFKKPALANIIRRLADVKYLNEVIFTVGAGVKRQDFLLIRKMASRLPQRCNIIWNDGRNVQQLFRTMQKSNISTGVDGKGRSVWMAMGFALAEGRSKVMALHDCDILSYDTRMIARMCFPIVNTETEFLYTKGFYSRVTDKMHGRVTRLFVTPLIRALQDFAGRDNEYLKYMDSFRYILAGEFAMDHELVKRVRIPCDWGLEVGMLSEVFRNCSLKQICEAEILSSYEHKHQRLVASPRRGLNKMVIDITKSIFSVLASEGVDFRHETFENLAVAYRRIAQDLIAEFYSDAAFNNIGYRRDEEQSTVDMFTRMIIRAGKAYLSDPLDSVSELPNWNRVNSAIPEFHDIIREAVRKDMSS